MAALLLRTLEQHPGSFSIPALRARLAGVCGDGALTLGGPDHRHSSTKAAELLWKRVHTDTQGDTPESATWDAFHRIDLACWRAVRRVPMAALIFDVSKQLDALFCQDEGVLLFRGTAAAMGLQHRSIRAPGGTRKVGYLAATPGSILQSYKMIVASLHARVEWVAAGHSVQTKAHLTEVARQLSDVAFVGFGAVMDDILGGILRPLTLQAQKAAEPAVFALASRRAFARLGALPAHVRQLRRLLRVISLCRQWATPAELVALWSAHSVSRAGRLLPAFFQAVAEMLADSSPVFQGVALSTLGSLDPSETTCLGAHCQCHGRLEHARTGAPAASRGPVVVRGRELLVPFG